MVTNLRIQIGFKQSLLLIIFTAAVLEANTQNRTYTKPPLTDKYEVYRQQVKKDPDKKMTELKALIPGLVYNLRYATSNNFMKRLMYPAGTHVTFLRAPAAKALQKVQEELNKKGMGLKIFDAYRPYSVTVKFWELVKDERYVANPSRGSGHNRGIAIDLTLIEYVNGRELEMGTDFDNFSDTAHHGFNRLPEKTLNNRALLKTTMEKNGFKAYNDEWWHYTFSDGKQYEILDIEFKKLRRPL
jgi:D-alanyl-D-alanine dipeptidase